MKRIIYLLTLVTLLTSWTLQDDVLNFSAFKIKDESGKTQMRVNKKGNIKMGGKLLGVVHKNGTLTSKEGKVIASISSDGLLKDATGKTLVKIDENGKIDNGSGMYIQWTEKGVFMKGEENTGITMYPVDKDSYQTASLILFLYLSFS